jgi:hypothetical protein
MKTAKRGEAWDVFETNSDDGGLQIQRVDCPDAGDVKFSDDDAAKSGNKEAIDALWEVLPYDGLVNRILWVEAEGWTHSEDGLDLVAFPQ